MDIFKIKDNKLLISILVFISISILLINLYIIYRLTEVNKAQNHIINTAGKQRMLSQKITKDILLYVYSNNDISEDEILDTVNRFQNNLDYLINENNNRNISISNDDKIIKQQKIIENMWFDFKNNLYFILNNENDLNNIDNNLDYIIKNSDILLFELDKLVDLYEEKTFSKRILSVQGIIFIFGSIIIFATWWIANNIIYNSEIDELTNIYNRKNFNKIFKRKIKEAQQLDMNLSLVMFDIDDFKSINDNYGHSFGDKIIIEIVEIVNESIRDKDVFARWGGEEFLIIVPNNNLKSSVEISKRLKEKISDYNFDKVKTVTCSFGVVEYQEGDTINRLIKRADEALYKAKKSGRNNVCYKKAI